MEYVFELGVESVAYWLATALWLGEFVVFRSRPPATGGAGGANAARRKSFLSIFLVILGSFVVSGALYTAGAGNIGGALGDGARTIGTFFYCSGILLRYWAAWTLGGSFSRYVQALPDQPLVTRGPYRRLRHPLYLGLYLLALGMNLMITNAIGIGLAALSVAWVIDVRMEEEESLMEEVIGERYRRWKERRERFIPFVF